MYNVCMRLYRRLYPCLSEHLQEHVGDPPGLRRARGSATHSQASAVGRGQNYDDFDYVRVSERRSEL